ncbi:MAG: hypothetical protein K6347_06855 [Campylobacterales bacterium]
MRALFSDLFYDLFNETRDTLCARLEQVINTKAFYLDRLLWWQAERFERVRRFFTDAQIKGE